MESGPWIDRFMVGLRSFANHEGLTWKAIDGAREILVALDLNELKPSRIAPTVNGSIAISFLRDDFRSNIEVFSDGEVAAVIAPEGRKPEIRDIEGPADWLDLFEKIKQELEP